jgi:hypothetical protein
MVVQKIRVVIILAVDRIFDGRSVRTNDQDIIDLGNSSTGLSLCVDWVPLHCQLQ